MEPRSFNRGDPITMTAARGFLLASMEPRSFNRGDRYGNSIISTRITRLQWSHGRLTVVTARIKREGWEVIGFNGATVV